MVTKKNRPTWTFPKTFNIDESSATFNYIQQLVDSDDSI